MYSLWLYLYFNPSTIIVTWMLLMRIAIEFFTNFLSPPFSMYDYMVLYFCHLVSFDKIHFHAKFYIDNFLQYLYVNCHRQNIHSDRHMAGKQYIFRHNFSGFFTYFDVLNLFRDITHTLRDPCIVLYVKMVSFFSPF